MAIALSKEVPLSELLMQDPDQIVDLTSPLNSVDYTSKDRIFVQEELEKRLKQRAGRQDLVERNILPPLSFPTAPKLFTNSQQLHRAQIADNLQKKMRNRPARDNLLQMNILPDLQLNIDPALQATQLQLRKSKLADSLNDKIANRPGPLQLLQNGIIEPRLSQVVKGYELEQTVPPASKDISPCTSSSNDTLNFSSIPEISLYPGEEMTSHLMPLQQRHSVAGGPFSADVLSMDTNLGGLGANEPASSSFSIEARKFSDSSLSPAPSPLGLGVYDETRSPEKSPRNFSSTYPPPHFKSALSASGGGVTKSSTSVARKKQQKKYRKLRYHEYVPPSKSTPKGGKTNPKPPSKSDSPYSSLLQQQQLFLQLQVLQKQYPNGVLMQKLPEMVNTLTKEQKALAIAAVKGRITVTSPSDLALGKHATIPQILPVEIPNRHNTSSIRFEDLKVNDLKTACKELGMIVSGKKAELVERLMDHNKDILPASALPENLPKDGRRQVFSMGHGSSVDSQFSNSSTISPSSPNASPVFKFPADQGGQDCTSSSGVGAGSGVKQSNLVQLPEVFSAANLHKEINEMIERRKRNYICQKGMSEKSIAPRPELTELLAIKLPPSYPISTAAHVDQRGKGSGSVPGNSRSVEPRTQAIASEKLSPHSLPGSPKPDSPANTPGSELMDATEAENKLSSIVSSHSTPTSDMGMGQVHSLSSGLTTAGGQMGVGNVPLQSMAAGGSVPTTSYYQQQRMASGVRPGRSSVPSQIQSSVGGHPMGPPSYNSIMRSRSITGTHPNLLGLRATHSNMNNGMTFGSEVAGMATPPNEMSGKANIFGSDAVDMDMDTSESSISDIFDILRAEGEEFGHPSPMSLPTLGGSHTHHPQRVHSSVPPTPQYGGHSAKLGTNIPQDSNQSPNYMLGNIMPFGNPSLTAQNKSGSDMCLNVVDGGREGQKNSVGSTGLYVQNNSVVLGNELNWLDLDNTGSLGLSPTLPGNTFSSLNSHSNPGSLPHEQFQHTFIEDGMGTQTALMGSLAKNSNPAMNGFGMGMTVSGISPYLEVGAMNQSGLYPATEEERLLELGLSS